MRQVDSVRKKSNLNEYVWVVIVLYKEYNPQIKFNGDIWQLTSSWYGKIWFHIDIVRIKIWIGLLRNWRFYVSACLLGLFECRWIVVSLRKILHSFLFILYLHNLSVYACYPFRVVIKNYTIKIDLIAFQLILFSKKIYALSIQQYQTYRKPVP